MATPLDLLQQRQDEAWIIGGDGRELVAIATQTLATLTEAATRLGRPPVMLLAEPDPDRWLAQFIAACSCPCTVVLCNPQWGESEWRQVEELVGGEGREGRGREGEGEERQELGVRSQESGGHESRILPLMKRVDSYCLLPSAFCLAHLGGEGSQPLILIPTGGSSGKLRLAMHTWGTLTASVAGFRKFFGGAAVNSLCVLPLYHVSGLMQFLRSLLSGGKFAIVPFKTLSAGTMPALPPEPFFLSLVPTQLQRLFNQADADATVGGWAMLQSLPSLTILLGGAPAWDSLLQRARQANLRVAPTYGMTETAAQVVTVKPEAFLAGRSQFGQVLPHAQVMIRDEAGNPLPPHHIGRVVIRARSLMLGYFPTSLATPELETEDLGMLDEAGQLQVVGRRDGTIISGGENIFPAEVEAAIWQTELVQDVCVVGLPDADWGAVVTAVYVPLAIAQPGGLQAATDNSLATAIQTAITPHLSRYKQPKHWLAVAALPRNPQGKLNRPQVIAIAQTLLSQA